MPDERLARALGNKTRRDMIHRLLDGRFSVHQLAEALGLSEVNASKHLKKLYDLGLLSTFTEGRERYYEIKIREIQSLIEQYDIVVRKLGGEK